MESELTSQVGSASARILLSAIAEKKDVALTELVELVEEASQTFQFNHEVLQSSVEHIQQGISVVDRDLSLLAWNHRYVELFDFPSDFIHVGISIRELLEFNASRGLLGDIQDIETEINKRVAFMQKGSSYKFLRTQKDGKVIEITGSPLPGGGFVTTYSDISEYIRIQQELREATQTLESRVQTRTLQLQKANADYKAAKLEAEAANESKTRFLAAAGHDLMQPFNAATLFASMLQQKVPTDELRDMSSNLLQSLNSAEELLSMLLDMTKLESGVLHANVQSFAVDDILSPLVNEFSLMAKQKGITLKYVKSSLVIKSDKKLLRRIVQNLISNAIRYTHQGGILVGLRRHKHSADISVIDTGLGIAEHNQQQVFEEFRQLDKNKSQQGLGLGLTIVDRISHLLAHQVSLRSTLNKGSAFSVNVPLGKKTSVLPSARQYQANDKSLPLLQQTILVVENEPQTLEAVSQLLESWGATVLKAASLDVALALDTSHLTAMLLDYHLDSRNLQHGQTGIQVAHAIREREQRPIPGILNSASRDDWIREEASNADLHFLPKPLKTAAFLRLMRHLGVAN